MSKTKIAKENIKNNIVLIRAFALIAIVYLSGFSEALAEQMINNLPNPEINFNGLVERFFVLFFSTVPSVTYLAFAWRDDNTVIFETENDDTKQCQNCNEAR